MSNFVASIAQRRLVGSATKKAVLMYMAERASDDGTGIWTSKSHMSADTELSKRAVQTAIKDFEASGIVKQVGTRSCKHGFTFEYSIDVEALKALPSTREETGAPHSPVHHIHPKGCTTFTPRGAPHSPKPSIEPSIEPSTNARDESDLFSGKVSMAEEVHPKAIIEEKFKEFWKVFPKKIAPDKSRRNFERAVKSGVDPDLIISAAKRYAKSDAVQRGFVKHPQGWLTDERWNDRPPQEELTPAQIRLRAILGKEAAE